MLCSCRVRFFGPGSASSLLRRVFWCCCGKIFSYQPRRHCTNVVMQPTQRNPLRQRPSIPRETDDPDLSFPVRLRQTCRGQSEPPTLEAWKPTKNEVQDPLALSLPVVTNSGPPNVTGPNCESYRRSSVSVHEMTPAALSSDTLGMRIISSHGVWRTHRNRTLSLRSALRVLMHRRCATDSWLNLV